MRTLNAHAIEIEIAKTSVFLSFWVNCQEARGVFRFICFADFSHDRDTGATLRVAEPCWLDEQQRSAEVFGKVSRMIGKT